MRLTEPVVTKVLHLTHFEMHIFLIRTIFIITGTIIELYNISFYCRFSVFHFLFLSISSLLFPFVYIYFLDLLSRLKKQALLKSYESLRRVKTFYKISA